MLNRKAKLSILSLVLIFVLFSGFGCRCVSREVQEKMQPIKLTYWRVWDGPDAFAEILERYRTLHPFITIEYRKLRYDEFEQALIEAFAADRGPDIFSIQNTWIRKYKEMDLLAPMPASITMAYPVVKGSIKKEVVTELRTTPSISLKQLKADFIDVVYKDVVINEFDERIGAYAEKVYGLPLFIDTLAVYYNNDLFNNAGITTPPAYWNREFQQDVKKLTKQDNKGQIIQSGVALGGGDNVDRSSDILSILMMQNGTEMINDRGSVMFSQRPADFENKNIIPGLDALRFYVDFSNPAKEVYCWNNNMGNSMDMFLQNKLAMMFGYAYMMPQIRADAPKLKFSVAELPQIEGNPQNTNFANYWAEVVSRKSRYSSEAWDFVQFITKAEQAKSYLAQAKKPPALRALVDEMKEDKEIGVFVGQTLTAESWYRGINADAAETIMREMIDDVVTGKNTLEDALKLGAQKVQQTINKK
ncbi:MAG: extracellular solute-binding protein [Candidatus Falkowbacteria bacterium]